MPKITLKTQAKTSVPLSCLYLREYCQLFGQVLRTAFSEINKRGFLESKKQLTALQKEVCQTLEQQFGIFNIEIGGIAGETNSNSPLYGKLRLPL